jgi:hypothetical protein
MTRIPFLTFLDPDDRFVGNSLPEALDMIIPSDDDVTEFV